jgi:transcriptional regulator
MYLPAHFAEDRPEEIDRIVAENPLAILVAHGANGLTANHVPILRDGAARLIGHVALANDLHRDVPDGAEVMAVFRGTDGYISPNWYPSKQEHHRHVPTWNYQAVHLYGTIRFSHDPKAKTAVVGRLTKYFEALANGRDAWRMADAPRDYFTSMLDAIVAFEIAVTRVVAKSKLSQNRTAADHANVVRTLESRGSQSLADAMAATGTEA